MRIYPNLVRSSDTPLSRSDIDASGITIAPDDQAEEPLPEGKLCSYLVPEMFLGICASRLRDEPDSL